MLPPTVSVPPVMLIAAVAALLTSNVVAPMVRFVVPARVSEPPLTVSVDVAVLTVVAALTAEFCAPMENAVLTVVEPPLILIVAIESLPVAKPAPTVLIPIVTVPMVLVPPLMLTVEVASPVELPAVRATLLVLMVRVPIVDVPPPILSVPVTLPDVAVVPERAARLKVVASIVPVSKEKLPVPLAEVCALRPPTATVPSKDRKSVV